ncbi:MAG: TlpA disulfide reductase family protein [Chitinophagaceae bacterium]
MKRISLSLLVLLISISLLQAQKNSLDDSTAVYKDRYGKVLNKQQVQELTKGQFGIQTGKLADGRKVITIVPAEDSPREAQRKMIESFRKGLIGKKLSDFKFDDIKGNKLNRKELEGKVIVINFWFTSCKPCILEMPFLNELVAAYKDKDVVFIAPALDKEAGITKFLQKFTFNYQVVAGQEAYANKLQVENFPTHIIADKKGIIKQVEVGYNSGIKNILGKTIEGLL